MNSSIFGLLPDGRPVQRLTLAAPGIAVAVLTLGATLHGVRVPDAAGRMGDVLLGLPDLAAVLASRAYVGSIVGRVANRIAGGRFRLDGRDYQVPPNDGAHALHGGPDGFDRRLWTLLHVSPTEAVLSLVSPDGDQGFPGALTATVRYALSDRCLTITITATTDRPTLCCLTSHGYWNLAGGGSVEGHVLAIPADAHLPVDAGLIPTGERRPVAGTPFDFRAPTAIGARLREPDPQLRLARGYDHNMILADVPRAEPRPVARLHDPASGRRLTLSSNLPGLQVYSGNFLDGSMTGADGRAWRQGDAVALEPQLFPDTANQPAFGSVRLDPGQVWRHDMEFAFNCA